VLLIDTEEQLSAAVGAAHIATAEQLDPVPDNVIGLGQKFWKKGFVLSTKFNI
jgi:hypothetical protein